MKKYWLTFDVLSTVLITFVNNPPTSASIRENVNGERGEEVHSLAKEVDVQVTETRMAVDLVGEDSAEV